MLRYKRLIKKLRYVLTLETGIRSGVYKVKSTIKSFPKMLRLRHILLKLEIRKNFGMLWEEEPER